ncbi:hypothetical protein F3Y22_tig00110895pilonHSYRG00076 [Hibiscus syriacus]|uniref:Reverse transcriptase domain-containing protein n=1 Tax=Hibiscus syriacus TaxID=106335 RepID=A0A6A2ZE63_HIBSY|nr:hypothetical protein F3Y22_tig00110895pilonHSYRG00076 [Hibiscus syriacus]
MLVNGQPTTLFLYDADNASEKEFVQLVHTTWASSIESLPARLGRLVSDIVLADINHCRLKLNKFWEEEEVFWGQPSAGPRELATDLFGGVSLADCQPVLNGIHPCITTFQNTALLLPFTAGEMKTSVFKIPPLKAPGLGVFHASFYQTFWDTVGVEVIIFCLQVLNERDPMSSINKTIIALIPKSSDAKFVQDYRSISLCNVLYKVMARMIVNRFKHVLGACIDPCQSAFILGRLITDNALSAAGTLHTFRCHRSGRGGRFELKLDMIYLKGTSSHHLLFADVCLIFGRAHYADAATLSSLIQCFENVSGFLKQSMMSRISQSSVHTLSRGGKLVLIEAVLQSPLTYQMSLYALPVLLCRELNSAIARFWWHSDASLQVVHWLGCRLFSGSNTLVAQVFKVEYYPDGSFLTVDLVASSILSLPLPVDRRSDHMVWRLKTHGQLSAMLIIFFYVSMRNERLQMQGTFVSIECFGHNRSQRRTGQESVLHALIGCSQLHSTWGLFGWDQFTQGHERDFRELMLSVLSHFSIPETHKLLLLLWSLWGARNRQLYQGHISSDVEIHGFVTTYLEELS